jgi:hypothetical protein
VLGVTSTSREQPMASYDVHVHGDRKRIHPFVVASAASAPPSNQTTRGQNDQNGGIYCIESRPWPFLYSALQCATLFSGPAESPIPSQGAHMMQTSPLESVDQHRSFSLITVSFSRAFQHLHSFILDDNLHLQTSPGVRN